MHKTKFERQGGLLLHPSSLPGPFGIGSLGKHARAFIDSLEIAGINIWQILPLGPTGFGDSPYQCFSAFAGNPYLVDLEALIDIGLLHESEVSGVSFPDDHVDFGSLIPYKLEVLRMAYGRFLLLEDHPSGWDYSSFCHDNKSWLDDYSLFRAIKESFGGKPWLMWPADLQRRDKDALDKVGSELIDEIGFQKFIQFLFFQQWGEIKEYANEKGVRILGDIPLYVALDSSDAWTQPEQFLFDDELRPIAVSGVPPDYFSNTGQLWGNPIFNWDTMRADGFSWWIRRVEASLQLFDILRIDHFRGLEAYWSVPYGEETAVNGKWVKAPGMELFAALQSHFGEPPLIAEDLGVITPEVEAMRDAYELPGMKILQFAFDSNEDNIYIPHSFDKNTVVYTGTHDNDTVAGWVSSLKDTDREFMLDYLYSEGKEVHWDLIRLAWASVASIAIVPVQDILGAGTEARMNIPGTSGGNWTWRLREGEFTILHMQRLAELSRIYSR